MEGEHWCLTSGRAASGSSSDTIKPRLLLVLSFSFYSFVCFGVFFGCLIIYYYSWRGLKKNKHIK